jgi:integrase/recombinase XerD
MKGCRVLSKEEITRLLDAAKDQRERMLVLTGLYFGTRLSESLALKFGDFRNTDYVRIKRNKKSDFSYLLIPQEYRSELEIIELEYKANGIDVTDETPLFISRQWRQLSRQQATKIIKDLKDRAGLRGKVAAHSLRKNFVTAIYELTNYDVVETVKYSGHKNLGNLLYYVATTNQQNLTKNLGWV